MERRRIEESVVKLVGLLSICLVLFSLIAMIATIVIKGLPALSLSLLTQTPKGGFYLGKEGGVLNAIVGSLYLAGGATLLAFIVSLPTALFLQNEYYGKTRMAEVVRLLLDILWGIPSIVYGAFGFIIMLYLGLRASLLGGVISLAFVIFPIMTRSIDEILLTIPRDLKEISYAVGATRLETTLSVTLKQAAPGILTGIILAFGRGIGDAASILFTAGYTDNIPSSLSEPVASLPLAIFFLFNTPYQAVKEKAYASAVILLFIILLLTSITRLLSRISDKYSIK
ncbi:Binding-protein-dependent transport system inner membrane component [uncultured archaeon]|nr:Binding-protein-dependent transport system inner membrane component [uncultured archaeon]